MSYEVIAIMPSFNSIAITNQVNIGSQKEFRNIAITITIIITTTITTTAVIDITAYFATIINSIQYFPNLHQALTQK